MINFLVFDLDDTLIPSTELYSKALERVGIDPHGKAYLQARDLTKETLPVGHTSSRDRLLYFKYYLEQSQRFSSQRLLDLMDKYEKALADLSREAWTRLNRNSLMRLLRSMGYQMAVLTNENTRTQMIKLQALDPEAKFFSLAVTSGEVGVEKPNGIIFKELTKRLPTFFSYSFTMIGDSLESDVNPALALGWKAFLTEEFYASQEAGSTVGSNTIERLKTLDELLERLPHVNSSSDSNNRG